MRRISCDQFEFDPPDSEQSLELAIARPSQPRGFRAFLTGCGASAPGGPPPDPGWRRWEQVRDHVRRFAGIELPHLGGCREVTLLRDEWNGLEVGPSCGPHLLWYYWSTGAWFGPVSDRPSPTRRSATPSAARGRELTDRLWERVRPLLPPPPAHPRGGRPFADDRACFGGTVYVLRNGPRSRQMPAEFPSGVTCRRRHRGWTEAGVWDGVWKLVLREPADAGRLKVDELVLDGTFVEAKRGASGSARAGSAPAPRSRSSPAGTAPRSGRRPTGPVSTR